MRDIRSGPRGSTGDFIGNRARLQGLGLDAREQWRHPNSAEAISLGLRCRPAMLLHLITVVRQAASEPRVRSGRLRQLSKLSRYGELATANARREPEAAVDSDHPAHGYLISRYRFRVAPRKSGLRALLQRSPAAD